MGKEHEIGILDVDVADSKKKLKGARAKYEGHVKYKRIEFLLKGPSSGKHSWARVRTDGSKTTITVKKFISDGLPMEEHEIYTNDFGDAVRLMSRMTNSRLLYFENEREIYKLGKAMITIDKWPRLPHYMEIEGPSMKYVKDMYKSLKIKGRYVGNVTAAQVYKMYGLNFREEMRKNDVKLKRILNK